jgi:hypothetical protein
MLGVRHCNKLELNCNASIYTWTPHARLSLVSPHLSNRVPACASNKSNAAAKGGQCLSPKVV